MLDITNTIQENFVDDKALFENLVGTAICKERSESYLRAVLKPYSLQTLNRKLEKISQLFTSY